MILMVTALFPLRGQEAVPVTGCAGAPQAHEVTVDVDQNGKLFYREGEADATSIHVCPGEDVYWTGGQDADALTISFSKPGNDESPADDGQILTSNQHRIRKHIKRRHHKTHYPYSVTLARGGMEYIDDPVIIIGH